MSHSQPEQTLQAARAALSHPLSFDEFVAKLSPKDRAAAVRRVDVLDAMPDQGHANVWRRLARALMTLAPFSAKLVGKQTVQFYVADGKFRMQVFALEDLQNGICTVYCPDVLDEAVSVGLLSQAPRPDIDEYVIASSGERLAIKRLDKSSANPAPHFKDMTGWNRKALRIMLPSSPSSSQVETAELLCAIAAQRIGVPRARVVTGLHST